MHGTGEVEVVVHDHLGVLHVHAHPLDLAHADLERREGLAAVARLPVAVPVAVLVEHPVDVRVLHPLGVEGLEGIGVAGVDEAGEPAVLLEPDLLDDPPVDQTDALATEEAHVLRRPGRDLRHGCERVAVAIVVRLEGLAAERLPELVEQPARLPLTNGARGRQFHSTLDDGLSVIVANPPVHQPRHDLTELTNACVLHDAISLTFWHAALRSSEPFGYS